MQEDFQKYVRSYVPGRMRIRHPGLVGLTAEDQKGIADYLQAIEGVRGVQINPVVGSLLLYWDPSRLSEADIDQYAAMFASMLPEPASALRTKSHAALLPESSGASGHAVSPITASCWACLARASDACA